VAKIVIFGAGDIARLADFYFSTDSEHEVVAFAVDAEFRAADTFLGRPLLAIDAVPQTYPPADYKMFVAVSYAQMNKLRAAKYAQVKALGYELVSYVSSHCTYLATDPPGDNCFILEDNTVQPFARIGSNVTLWSGNHVGHDATIADHCFISSHVVISGHCKIEQSCFLGVNATLRNGITIGEFSLIGAGALIMKSTRPKSVHLGQRAERFAKSSDEVEL
jgi:sugar O-acyltransferase (sialic acid O-acetyltransferase NeuD family)